MVLFTIIILQNKAFNELNGGEQKAVEIFKCVEDIEDENEVVSDEREIAKDIDEIDEIDEEL